MNALIVISLFVLFLVSAMLWGVDSRPQRSDRVERWWPAAPRV